MARDTEQLVLQLSADMRQFQKEMVRAAGEADKAAQRIERRFEQQNQRAIRGFQDFGAQVRTILAAIGIGAVVRDVVELGSAWTRVGNALSMAGVEADQLAAVQDQVADIASRTRSDLEATADLYARMLRSSEDLGASMEDVAQATETVSKALAGASQSERSAAIRQLGQALGAGTLAGDELRSILENSRVLAEAIADEFGVGVGQLRELGKAGQLESERVLRAILNAQAEIDASFARVTFTVADEFTRLRTEAARFIGTNQTTSRSVKNLAGLVKLVADNFDLLASAIMVAAAALGGGFAAQAVVQAIRAVITLKTEVGAFKNLITGLGGWWGIGLTAGITLLAGLAANTDLFTSAAERAARASDSLYSALQTIVSLGERLDEVAVEGAKAAESTSALATAAGAANDALDGTPALLTDTADAMSIAERASRGLAEAEKQRAIATIEAALADQQLNIAAERRAITARESERRRLALRGRGDMIPRNVRDELAAESERLREADRQSGVMIIQAQESARILSDALAAVRSINSEWFAPRSAAGGGGGGGSGVEDSARAAREELERTYEAARKVKEEIERQDAAAARTRELEHQREQRDMEFELQLARARGDEEAIRALERREEIEKRILELQRLGLDAAAARDQAKQESAELEQARLEGQFRETFTDGVMAALHGDLGDFFEDWMREKSEAGLRKALDSVADVIFRIFAQAMSQGGSSGDGGFWADLAGAVFGAFVGGGKSTAYTKPVFKGKADGGQVAAGGAYMVGERGPEAFVPTQPGVVIPNGALGAKIDASDRRTINFTGTSEELAQLRAVLAADMAARQRQIISTVDAAITSRHLGRQ